MASTANPSLFSEKLFTGTLMLGLSGSDTAMNALKGLDSWKFNLGSRATGTLALNSSSLFMWMI